MEKVKIIITVGFIILMIFCTVRGSLGEGLDTLIQVGKDQQGIQLFYNDETEKYIAVRLASQKGDIREGMGADDIRSKYGEPAVIVNTPEGVEWIYKKSGITAFDKKGKIYIRFDGNNNVKKITDMGS